MVWGSLRRNASRWGAEGGWLALLDLHADGHQQLTSRGLLPPALHQGDEAEIAKLTERMKAVLGPFVLRRLKTEVAGELGPFQLSSIS